MTLDRLVRIYHIITALEELKLNAVLSKASLMEMLHDNGLSASERTLERDFAEIQRCLNVTIEYVWDGYRRGYRINMLDEDPTEFNGFSGFLKRVIKGNLGVLIQAIDFLDSVEEGHVDTRRARCISAMLKATMEDEENVERQLEPSPDLNANHHFTLLQ